MSRIGKGFAIFFLAIFLLVAAVLVLIQTPGVQDFARKKIVAFLEEKLDTKVAIGRLDIDFPKMVVLEDLYVEDQTRDTLIAGHQLKVDISLFRLLYNEVRINEINLNGITVKLKRQLPDTLFNFQFIADAFASEQEKPASTDTSAMRMAVEKLIVDNTRFVFKDVVSGNDVDVHLGHFDTSIETFDPVNLVYEVPRIAIKGLRGRIRQTTPLEITAVNTNPDPAKAQEKPKFFKFINRETRLQDIDFAYSNEVSATDMKFRFKNLKITPKNIDLEKSLIALNQVQLDDFEGKISLNAKTDAKVVKLTTQTDRKVQTEYLPWRVTVDAIRLNNNRFIFDDNTKSHTSSGMDFAHLGIQQLTLHADDFLFNRDTIAARVIRGTMKEKSGFALQELHTEVRYTSQGAQLNNLVVKTPGTEISRSIVVRYPSLEAVKKNPATATIDLDINHSYIQLRDVLTFVPTLAQQPAFQNPNAILYLNTRVKGSLAQLNIPQFQFSGFGSTRAAVSGTIANATDPDRFRVDLNIHDISTSREDLLLLIPPKSMPDSITLPESISLKGLVKGTADSLYTDLGLNTTLGNISVKGRINQAARPKVASYAVDVALNELNAGAILQQPQTFGKVTAEFSAKGKGIDPKTANTRLSGVVRSVTYNRYTYRNFRLDGSLANQQFKASGGIKDPNIHLAFNAKGALGGKYPAFAVTADVDSIKTGPLHLTTDPMIYRGKITADFPALNLNALNGNVHIVNSLLVANNQRVTMDSLSVVATHENGQQSLVVKADFVNVALVGQYKPAQLGNIFIQSIQPYYAISTGAKTPPVDPYDFTIDASISDHPALHVFLPDLKRLDVITLVGKFSGSDGWNATLTAPHILMGTNKIANLSVAAATRGDKLQVTTTVAEVSSGENLALWGTRLRADIADNKVDFAFRVGDASNRDKYRVQGLFSQEPNNIFAVSLRPDSLMLNYDSWNINNDNLIRFGKTLVNARNFDLNRNNQHLILNSQGEAANSPLEVRFADFKLATLTGFVQADSLIADGSLNGNILLNNLTTQPNFTTDLTINNLAIKSDTIGDVRAKVDNTKANVFAADVTITGRGNDVALTGNYYLRKQNKSTMDLNLAIRQLQLNTIEGASMGFIRDGKGYITGNVKIGNTFASPDIDGTLGFNETSLVISMLNSQFKIDNEQIIAVNNKGLQFNTFTVQDEADNKLVINGMARTTNYIDYNFDLSVRARNFRALNTTQKDNKLYYGQLYFNTNLKIGGTEAAPVIDGTLRVNEDTKFTVVLPQAQPGVVERDGIVVFVDKDAPFNDSLFMAAIDTMNTSSLRGMDVSVNIEIDKKAELGLVIDEGNGDFIKLQGEAILNGGIDKSGKVTLTGVYELESGAYEMSFNFLHRRFDIQKGSKITWIGEPTNAVVDITAVYIANTSAIELVQDQISAARTDLRYRQKLPFEVYLNMDGQLMKPLLTFDIVLPEESSVRIDNEIAGQVEMRLNQLKAEPSELNKQVFALLLLNRFVSENPFESAGGGLNAETLARQSVSKILTEQLNNLASDLIAGVDINFDVVSSEDYTSGSLQNKTDLNVGVSKRLLNDRLNVSIGTNFELEGGRKTSETGTGGGNSASPNVEIEYFLTQDGRYLLRAYRRNEYEGVVEGYVVETGVGFVLSVDYDKFKEIFEARQKRRAQMQERRRQENKNQPPEKPANPPVEHKSDAVIPDNNTRKDEEEN